MKLLTFTLLSFVTQTAYGMSATPPSTMTRFIAQMLPFIVIVAVFYFFIIRPQTQRRKALAKMIEDLKPGDNVITNGGIIGKIFKVENHSFVLELYDGNKVEFLKGSIASKINEKSQ